MKIPCCEKTIQGNKTLMSAELAHQKADKHLCVALARKVRIRFYTLLWNLFVALQAIWGSRQVPYDCIYGALSVNKVKNDIYSSLIPIKMRKFAK